MSNHQQLVKQLEPIVDSTVAAQIINKLDQLGALNPFYSDSDNVILDPTSDLPQDFYMISPLYRGAVTYVESDEGWIGYVDIDNEPRITTTKGPKDLLKKINKYRKV